MLLGEQTTTCPPKPQCPCASSAFADRIALPIALLGLLLGSTLVRDIGSLVGPLAPLPRLLPLPRPLSPTASDSASTPRSYSSSRGESSASMMPASSSPPGRLLARSSSAYTCYGTTCSRAAKCSTPTYGESCRDLCRKPAEVALLTTKLESDYSNACVAAQSLSSSSDPLRCCKRARN